jgi:divalent metal cation (Fe/Co/Zn/Cd) transporter
MSGSRSSDIGNFFALFIAFIVIIYLIAGEWYLITNTTNNTIYNNILLLGLAILIIGFSYIFVKGIIYNNTGSELSIAEREIHYKKTNKYMISLWIMIGVSFGCSLGYWAIDSYL